MNIYIYLVGNESLAVNESLDDTRARLRSATNNGSLAEFTVPASGDKPLRRLVNPGNVLYVAEVPPVKVNNVRVHSG